MFEEDPESSCLNNRKDRSLGEKTDLRGKKKSKEKRGEKQEN